MILGYVRVSTNDQKDNTSPDEQERKIKAIADLRNATPYDLGLYRDLGVSGGIKLWDRPEGKRMLADAQPGDCIVASKLDRLFRSASDALATAEELKNKGIDLILVDMGTDAVTGNGVARMFFGMLALVAEFERDRINERTEAGRRYKKSKNGHLGGPPPYGFEVIGSGKDAKLAPKEGEREIMLSIKQLMRERTPMSAMREAERMGLRDRAGSPFRIPQLQRIAARELALG